MDRQLLVRNALKVFSALFNPKVSSLTDKKGRTWNIRKFANGAVRGIDAGPYRYIIQNPNKTSDFAARARNGEKIMWVIKRPRTYVARVIEGKVELL